MQPLCSIKSMEEVQSNQTLHHDLEAKPFKAKNGGIENTFLSCIGGHEIYSQEMWRAALTELMATATLMFTLTTSIISNLDSHESDPKLLVPVTVFAIVFLFLIVTVPLSGGHMSPVFTFIAALKGIITITRASIYILFQCIGSIVGFIAIKSVLSHEAAEKHSLGGCAIAINGAKVALTLEFCCTLVVLYVGVTIAFDKGRCEALGLTMVCVVVAGVMALVVFVSINVTGQAGYSGVGLNPARCLGSALVQGGSLWDGHWVFWVGPFFACIVYYGFSKNLPKEGLVMGGDHEYDFVNLVRFCRGRECKESKKQTTHQLEL